jgi:ketosteroid isomerase-like protein
VTTPLVAKTPEETSLLFEKGVNEQDLEGLITLFEPNAVSVTSPTESIRGLEAIRENLRGLLAMTKTIRLAPSTVIKADELAEVVGDWTLEGTDPAGKPLSIKGRYIDVVRRQPDRRWLFVIDNSQI